MVLAPLVLRSEGASTTQGKKLLVLTPQSHARYRFAFLIFLSCLYEITFLNKPASNFLHRLGASLRQL